MQPSDLPTRFWRWAFVLEVAVAAGSWWAFSGHDVPWLVPGLLSAFALAGLVGLSPVVERSEDLRDCTRPIPLVQTVYLALGSVVLFV